MKAPLFYSKILLFGEYGIIKNSKGLSIPYNFFKGGFKIGSFENKNVKESNSNLIDFKNFLTKIDKSVVEFDFDKLEEDLKKGMFFDSSIPQGYGVGSSGALVAALYDRYALNKITVLENLTKPKILILKNIFSRMESFFHGKSSGLDPLNSYLSLPILIHSKNEIETTGIPSQSSNGKGAVFLLDSGISSETAPMVDLFFKSMKNKNYNKIIAEEDFIIEYNSLLKDYVGRPTPLYFAERMSEKYKCKVYLKREDLCHTGAHKINNTIGQILLAKRLGKTRIIAETGAGQHGVATATVCALAGIECVIYMGSVDIKRQAPNVARMKMLGASIIPAESGSKTLKDATNEAIRDWINNPLTTHYIIGSVVGPHPYPDMVAKFQSIVSKEIKSQLFEKEGTENPDYLIANIGGGSNAAGLYYEYLENEKVKIISVEAAGKGVESGKSAATSVLGKVGIIHGSKTLLMQTTDGQIIEPYSISAGLDYPGVGPLHAHLLESKRAQFISITDEDAMEAGLEISKLEGIIPAIETAHAFAAFKYLEFKEDDIVVVNFSGRGDKDLNTYIEYFDL